MAGAFNNAWILLKNRALDTQDLRQAARTGGLRETPERKQAYRDVGMPYNAPPMLQTIRDARFGLADITPVSHTGSQRDAESLMESQKSTFAFKEPALDRTKPLGARQRIFNPVNYGGFYSTGGHEGKGQFSELHHPGIDQGDILHPNIMTDPEFNQVIPTDGDGFIDVEDILEGQPAPSTQEIPSSEPFDIINRRVAAREEAARREAESERARQELVAQRRQEMMSRNQPTQPVQPQITQAAQNAAMQAILARQKELGLR